MIETYDVMVTAQFVGETETTVGDETHTIHEVYTVTYRSAVEGAEQAELVARELERDLRIRNFGEVHILNTDIVRF